MTAVIILMVSGIPAHKLGFGGIHSAKQKYKFHFQGDKGKAQTTTTTHNDSYLSNSLITSYNVVQEVCTKASSFVRQNVQV